MHVSMPNFLQRWLGGGDRAPVWDLADYPPFELPHPGSGRRLSESQAQENWVYSQATLAGRQARLRCWLLAHDGPDPGALTGVAYARALKAWALAHWPRLPVHDRLPEHAPWPDCRRDGPFIVYSLLGDLAASLGEAIRQCNGHWRWGLNLDAIDLADDMATSRRVVLLAALRHPTPEAQELVLDPEAWVFAAHRFPNAVDFRLRDAWSDAVADALAADHGG